MFDKIEDNKMMKIPAQRATKTGVQRFPGRPKKPNMISHPVRMSKELLSEIKDFANKNYGEGAGLSPVICNIIKGYLNNKNTK